MNRAMKKTTFPKRLLLTIMALAMVFCLSGCSLFNAEKPDYSRGDNAAFVRSVAYAVTTRTGDYPFLLKESTYSDLHLEPYFALEDFKAEQDPDDPATVHYSCRIPGTVAVCFNMAYGVCFQGIDRYSKWVPIEGDVRIVEKEDGRRLIDLTGEENNVFTLFRSLRYFDPLYFRIRGMDPPEYRLSKENFNSGMDILLSNGSIFYASLLGKDVSEYINETVIPELSDANEHASDLGNMIGSRGYGTLNWYYSLSGFWKFLIWGTAVAVVLGITWLLVYLIRKGLSTAKERRKEARREKIRKRELDICSSRSSTSSRLKDVVSYEDPEGARNFGAFSRRVIRSCHYDSLESVRVAEKLAVTLASKPAGGSEDLLRFLCININQGIRLDSFSGGTNLEAYRNHILTMAGWSAAALGRILAKKMKPKDIAENLKRLSPAVDKYNAVVKELQEHREEQKSLEKKMENTRNELSRTSEAAKQKEIQKKIREDEFRQSQLKKEIKNAETKLSGGIGCFMLDNKDLPLAYLVHILGDVGTRVPRFINQGIIMGLVDWLMKHESHPEAKKLLNKVVTVRADMIRSDRELSFFETRVPEGISRRDYALLLKDVLHCANPSMKFCDTEKLLSIAEEEVPDCMDMLYRYPLRLIDPVNRRTLGFYKFEPYIHEMFVQYIPPLKTGRVVERYHEVDDRTKPLSSGLNLQLFLDPYAVIPTIYHEYQHFCGDPNEASVFLRTQMFSISFYKKYRDAKASADGVFATLSDALGTPPDPGNRERLNELVTKYYGEQKSKEAAQAHADREIEGINNLVDLGNGMETWCPEVKMPHLSRTEDEKNMSLITKIIIRFDTVPKSVTDEEFRKIIQGAWKKPPEGYDPPEEEGVRFSDDEVAKLLGQLGDGGISIDDLIRNFR